MLGIATFTALSVYIIKPAMDDIFVNKDGFMLRLMPAAILGVFLFKGGFSWANSYLLEAVGLEVVNSLRQQLYNHIQDMPLAFFDRMPTGILMSRITNDTSAIAPSRIANGTTLQYAGWDRSAAVAAWASRAICQAACCGQPMARVKP